VTMEKQYKIEDDGVVLRNTEISDIDWVLSVEKQEDNSSFVDQWSKERHLEAVKDPNIAHLIIKGKDGGDTRLGYIILTGIKDPNNSIHFRRIAVEAREKGRGVGSKAIRCVKNYVFSSLRSHRLWLNVLDTNERARSVYLKEGFVQEGLSRDAVKNGHDGYRSYIVMSMLDYEFNAVGDSE